MGVFFYNTLMPTYFKMETISYVSSFKASSTIASISNFPRLLKVCAALSSFKSECHKEGGGEDSWVVAGKIVRETWYCWAEQRMGDLSIGAPRAGILTSDNIAFFIVSGWYICNPSRLFGAETKYWIWQSDHKTQNWRYTSKNSKIWEWAPSPWEPLGAGIILTRWVPLVSAAVGRGRCNPLVPTGSPAPRLQPDSVAHSTLDLDCSVF